MKVLFNHHGLRGDVVIGVPAATFLHDEFGWDIDMPIHRGFADMAPLFLNHSVVRSVVITDEYQHFPSARDVEMLKDRGYHRVFNPMQPHRLDNWWATMHQTEAVLDDYMGMALPADYKQISLVKWFDVWNRGRTIAFAPFAGFASNPNNDKRLSTERAQEIVNYIRSKGWNVCQLGGPGEPILGGAECVPTLSYFDSVRCMLGCRALIHTDTGLGWVASAYQFPQLGMYGGRYYGMSKVCNIQPVNPNSQYLVAETVAQIPVDSIYQSIDNLLS